MDKEAASQKHESAIQDKNAGDPKDTAGDLSRSIWQKPGSDNATAGGAGSGSAIESKSPADGKVVSADGSAKAGRPEPDFIDLNPGSADMITKQYSPGRMPIERFKYNNDKIEQNNGIAPDISIAKTENSENALKLEKQKHDEIAKNDPENPHPDTWKRNDKGQVLEAGDKFKAEYDPKTGELMSVRQGNDEWRRGPGDTVVHSHTNSKGEVDNDVIKGVRSFTAEQYGTDKNGNLAGMTVEVQYGKTSSTAHSSPIYQDAEHSRYSDSVIGGWIGKSK